MQAAGIRRLVNAGTTWQHYLGQVYDPVNLYAATKQAFEAILKFYTSTRDFQAITLELTDTYGRVTADRNFSPCYIKPPKLRNPCL
jgi:nucleoside-diphosphate-sugar epimerase